MKDLATFSQQIIAELESCFSHNSEIPQIAKVTLQSQSLKIEIKIKDLEVHYSLSLHHLDMPWQFVSNVFKNTIKIGSVESTIDPQYDYSNNPRYEVYPNILNGTVSASILAKTISEDLISYSKMTR